MEYIFDVDAKACDDVLHFVVTSVCALAKKYCSTTAVVLQYQILQLYCSTTAVVALRYIGRYYCSTIAIYCSTTAVNTAVVLQ